MTVAPATRDDQAPIVKFALTWANAGCSVIPIRADGTKRPAVEWKRNQVKSIHPSSYFREFASGMGIGVVCGQVSGNLEMTELEGRATSERTLQAIGDACDDLGVGDAFARIMGDEEGYVELTPSGGIHLLYRISDHEVPGNIKIARRPATPDELARDPLDKVKVLAETRGEGGYVIVAPTSGTVHPSGLEWMVLSGEIGQIPAITWAQRNLIHQAINDVLDESPPPQSAPVTPKIPTQRTGSGQLPGDDYNERADWADILEPHGWTLHHYSGDTAYWTRPGKSKRDGHSATTGHAGIGAKDRLFVMSSATEFDADVPLSKFFVYTHYEHRGDFKAATRTLSRQGYGDQRPASMRQNVDFDWSQESNVDSPPRQPSPVEGPWEDGWDDSPEPKAEPAVTPFRLPRPVGIRDYTLSGAVVRFVDDYHRYIRYVEEEKTWRVWDGVSWVKDLGGSRVSGAFEAMTETMRAEAEALADDDPLKKPYQAHVRKLRNSSRASLTSMIASWVTASTEEFDADPRYLNLRNGVYDLVADRFLAHDPKYMLTKVAGVSYDPDAKAPRAEVFFADLLPSDQIREFTLQGLAYTLTGEADRKALFISQGASNTGKTQIAELAQGIFGDYAVSVSPGTFTRRREHGPNPELHNMRGARFVYTSETSHDIQLDEELVKRFTGKDTMSTRTLYEKPQQWIPQCVLWIATNNLPRFSSDSEAMWRRVKTIRFTSEFTDDGSSGHEAIPNIGRTLAKEEGSGLLNMLLDALRRYREAGRLVEPQELKDSIAGHRQDTDPLVQWVTEVQEKGQLVADPMATVAVSTLRRAYSVWCQDQGCGAMAAQRFGAALAALMKYEKRRSHGETVVEGWRWAGVTWNRADPLFKEKWE